MNPSDNQVSRIRRILLCFFTVTLLSVFIFGPSGDMYVDADGNKHVPGFFNDAVITYADQINGTKPVSDWHSSLYMYEGRVVHSFLEAITGQEVDGYLPQRFLMWVADILMLVNLSYWLALMLQRSLRMWWMALPLGLCMMQLHLILGVSLDFFFTTALFSAISLSILLYRSNKKWVLVLSCVAMVLLLGHMVEYRRNAALLLPIFVYLVTARFMPSFRIPLKASVAAVFTLLLYYVATHFIALCGLPIVDKPSLTPLVESDLRIAAISEDKREEEWERLRSVGLMVSDHEYRDSITAYWSGAEHPEDWDSVWEYYVAAWKNNTGNMLMARALQFSQFMWSGGTPWVVEKTADAMYPQMQNNPQRWKVLVDTDVKSLFVRLFRLALTLGTIVMCCRYVWLWLVRRRVFSPEQYLMMIITGAATAYSLSYIVVTPTADLRYLLPAQILGIIVMCYLALKKRFKVD